MQQPTKMHHFATLIPVQKLKVDLLMACDTTVKACEQLVEATKHLRQQPTSHQVKALLIGAAKGIKTGLVQV